MSMNDTSVRDFPDIAVLLRFGTESETSMKQECFNEMLRRLNAWGWVAPSTAPQRVIVDAFSRLMRQNNPDIPPDKIEVDLSDYEGIDWFQGEDDEDDLFKL